jgi:TolB-like protein
VVLALLLFAAALAVVAAIGRPRISLRVQSPETTPALAVLPFENLSGDPELSILASELAGAVARAVADTGRARLLPSEGTFELTIDRKGIEAAAKSLGADYVITGSLARSEGLIEVDAYLFRAGPDPALWVDRRQWNESERDSIVPELAASIARAILSKP